MRPVLGPGAPTIGHRGIALERCALITLRRDAYATPPGPTLGLSIGERTTYRPGAWLLDTFERPTLGAAYPAWGGSAGVHLVGGQVVPVTVADAGMATHTRELPRDSWAGVVIGALSGAASVGVLLRADDTPADGYRITATPTLTVVERLAAGVPTGLASVATPWRVGDMLRAVWTWDRLRVYRDLIVVAEVTDASRLVAGRAGLVARRGDAGAAAGITAFLGGETRQEFIGAGLDLGDVQRGLGQPARFDVALSNIAPLGGVDRFAELLRHGINTTGTYDLDRGSVRVLTVIAGAPAPLTAGVGLIDGITLTDDTASLDVLGRDAFLTPRLAPGAVTYLPGPLPGGLTPLPPDPCLPSPVPTVVPGSTPAEPIDPPESAGGASEGTGPDAPPESSDGAEPALPGAWFVTLDYTLTPGAGPLGEDIYIGTTTPTQYPIDPLNQDATSYAHLRREQKIGIGSSAYPEVVREYIYYRGPDIGGSTFTVFHATPSPPVGASLAIYGTNSNHTDVGLDYKVALYSAGGIHTESDLAALRPKHPGESVDPMPPRITTLRADTANVTYPAPFCAADPHADAAWFQTTPHNTEVAPIAPIGLGAFSGPQLFRMEIDGSPAVPTSALVYVWIVTGHLTADANVFAGSGPCGAGLHHFLTAGGWELAGPAGVA